MDDSIVYMDGGRVRRVRGVIVDPATKNDFIQIQRRDGEVSIKKEQIIKMEIMKKHRRRI